MRQASRTIADLVGKLQTTRRDAWQYLEVKQLAEILARHRAKARDAVRAYRLLVRATGEEADATEKLYMGYEAMFARDHLRDTLRLYMMVNRDYHEAFRAYMEEIRNPAPMFIPVPAGMQDTAAPVTPVKAAQGRKAA